MRSAAAACFLLLCLARASAADFPLGPAPAAAAGPAYNWSGFYIGLNAGYAYHTTDSTGTFIGGAAGGFVTSRSSNSNGAAAGGQLGVNFQFDSFVVGLEADADWTGQSNSITFSCGVGCVETNHSSMPWIATVRGRAGIARNALLLYVTAGAAFTELEQTLSANTIGTFYNPSSVNVGWVGGAGVEWAFARNWTVRAEYLYIQTDATLSGPFSPAAGGGTFSQSITLRQSLARVGLNFKYP